MEQTKRYFFCGIGGSGMLPLALIARARGHHVSGSDRSRDQGLATEKFAWLETQGITLFPQDGSGVTAPEQVIVASGAIEDSVPDIAAARELGCRRITRADLNSTMFNAAKEPVGVAGTSGKSTVTAMVAWILHCAGGDPTVMNGAIMPNFADAAHPFANSVISANARKDRCHYYVSEVDESDGSIGLYRPYIGILTNCTLDHKSLSELHNLFYNYLRLSRVCIINADDPESMILTADEILGFDVISYGFAEDAKLRATDYVPGETSSRFTVVSGITSFDATLPMPGRHNVSNALAAITATRALGISPEIAVEALAQFKGIARRHEIVGTANGITVIDDFAHNPDKVAATLATLTEQFGTKPRGRLLIFFQPHGYGPLRQMGAELAAAFAAGMRESDKLFVCDPVYFGGTVDRSVGSKAFVADVITDGGYAVYMSERASCGEAIVNEARSGDRILILGARDDTLSDFAREVLARL